MKKQNLFASWWLIVSCLSASSVAFNHTIENTSFELPLVKERPKSILNLYSSTGGGHKSISLAIDEYYKSHHKDISVETVDVFEVMDPKQNKRLTGAWDFVATEIPGFYSVLYNLGKLSLLNWVIDVYLKSFCDDFMVFMKDRNPDVIISSHPFTNQIVSYLKKIGKIKVPLISAPTDYNIHAVWINKQVDAYIVACEDMVDEISKFGIDRNKIHPIGVPVFEKFHKKADRGELATELGLDPNKLTVAMMAGLNGYGDLAKIYENLLKQDMDIQIVVLAGKNQEMYNKIDKIKKSSGKSENTKLLGFTRNVDEYMKVSDLMVTKAGGLSTSESLASNLPIAVFFALPGQEKGNVDFLKKHNLGIMLGEGKKGAEQIRDVLQDTKRLNSIKSSVEKFDKSECMPKLHEIVCGLYNTPI